MPARDVVDRAMADGDAPGHGDLHRCRLLLHAAGLVDQAILHEAVARVVVAFRARRPVDRLFALPLVVLEQGVAHCAGIADERDAVGTGAVDVTAPYRDPSVVVVDEDGVAARLVDDRILDAAVLRAVEDDRAAAIRGPVAAQQRLAVLHERAGGVAKSQTLERDEADRPPRRASEFDEMAEADHFDVCPRGIGPRRRIEVESPRPGVVEPLPGGIELLEDVLDHAIPGVHAHAAVVLPAALIGHAAARVLAGDPVMVVAPFMHMHRVDESAAGVGPAGGALGAEGVGREPVEVTHGRVEVRVAGHPLAAAVDEELVDGEAIRDVGLDDVLAEGFPAEVQPHAAAEDALLPRGGGIADGVRLGTGILGGEDERLGQVVDPGVEHDRDRLPARPCPRRPLRGRQRAQRRGRGASGVVPPRRSHVDLGRPGHRREDQNAPDPEEEREPSRPASCPLHVRLLVVADATAPGAISGTIAERSNRGRRATPGCRGRASPRARCAGPPWP